MAKGHGIKPIGLKEAELINAIMRVEENSDYVGTATDYCDQINCLFHKDCLR